MLLADLDYGPCIYGCGRTVTEEHSWGQEDQAYPPKLPYHTECRYKAVEQKYARVTQALRDVQTKLVRLRLNQLARRLVWCSYMMRVYGGFNAAEVPA